MGSFDADSFSTSSFSDQAFDFGAIVLEMIDYIITFRRRRR